MKIAILYSGYLRNFIETFKNNIEYLSNKDDEIHLYFSLWDQFGYADQINSPDFIKSKRILSNFDYWNKEVSIYLLEEIIYMTHELTRDDNLIVSREDLEKITIKNIKIETNNTSNCKMDLVNGAKNGLASQFYKVRDCFDLIDNAENYDFLVRLRCDMLLNNKMNNILDVVNDNKIIFSSKIWYDHEYQKGYRSINDMMWISNKENMKKACNIYNNVDKINKIIYQRNQSELNYGENVCFMNLEVENLVDNIYTHDFNYNILR